MRTYSRKRPDHQEIEGVQDLCRLCLTRAESTVPIFTDSSNHVCAALSIRIMMCIGLEVSNEDCLPNLICAECLREINRIYSFRKKCEVSYQKLKSHLQAVKLKSQNNDNIDKGIADTKEEDNEMKSDLPSEEANVEDEESNNFIFVINWDGKLELCDKSHSKVESLVSTSQDVKLELLQGNNTVLPSKEIRIDGSETAESSNNLVHSPRTVVHKVETLPDRDTAAENTDTIVDNCKMIVPGNRNSVSDSQNTVNELENLEIVAENNEIVVYDSKTLINNSQMVVDMEIISDNKAVSATGAETNKEETQQSTDSELSTCLSSLLIDLGILTRQDNTLSIADNMRSRLLQLVTSDGSHVTLELMEEDEEDQLITDSAVETKIKDEKCLLPRYGPVKMSDTVKTDESGKLAESATRAGRARSPGWAGEGGGSGGAGAGRARCGECGWWYATRGALQRHRRAVHERRRPHQCAVCGRAFAQKEVMTRHQLVHEALRPFQCGVCPKSFTQRGALAAHARSHRPAHARPLALHQCPRCPKLFLYSSGLSRHMMAHKGRLYSCGGCARQFRDKSSLNRHLKNTNHQYLEDAATEC